MTDIFSPLSSYVRSSLPSSPGTISSSGYVLAASCLNTAPTYGHCCCFYSSSVWSLCHPTVSLGKPEVVPQLTSSSLCRPTAVLAYRPVLGQYQVVLLICFQLGYNPQGTSGRKPLLCWHPTGLPCRHSWALLLLLD